jgi:hypothetical protein
MDKSASAQIDDIIANLPDWKRQKLTQIRDVINRADTAMVEEAIG